MQHRHLLLTSVLCLFLIKISIAAEYVALETRSDATQKFALIKTEGHALASVILMAGGNGKIYSHIHRQTITLI